MFGRPLEFFTSNFEGKKAIGFSERWQHVKKQFRKKWHTSVTDFQILWKNLFLNRIQLKL